ncbi:MULTISPECIES: GNAT family N-acetyltransferase [Pseudomonas]|uniref:GNAT family N-acetyltransferase n=1 Tax=Pseudomonas TaxID=286 RepID=UPI0007B39EC5|nr:MULTISPECIES: GNAT family protein [Pseudomonas]AZC50814.1 putative acetyltransferase [Pseudomonas chlororaphis subsp. piscium]AZC57385.1 putative acetyltransferase [Pseudomonas chlororaphis subsp. piscium]AZC63613.1 putative acetyltransferase [Pseudomonas chlororaphis subsp. piscium]AZC69852.1 putative acetyltransferase [Pseudomonas chlororaphis subsp. piscium]AZC76091.1 putative acetyltransferase [Pseudomonas chlororaphis subsp. piscium]
MSAALPSLFTPRLALKALQKHQAETLSELANGPEIADNTAAIPSPYTLETALTFIDGQEENFRSGQSLALGVHLRHSDELIGVISLRLSAAHRSGHLGGWTAAHCRNQGYAAEAAGVIMAFGFTELALHRVGSQCFARNKGSARVMEKIGLGYEGCMKGAFLKNGIHEDMLLYGLLRADWRPAS